MSETQQRDLTEQELFVSKFSQTSRLDVRVITGVVIGHSKEVFDAYGSGLPKSVYRSALLKRLASRGYLIDADYEMSTPRYCEVYDSDTVLIENTLLLAFSSVEEYDKQKDQIHVEIKTEHYDMGLLIDFDEMHQKCGVTKIPNGYDWH